MKNKIKPVVIEEVISDSSQWTPELLAKYKIDYGVVATCVFDLGDDYKVWIDKQRIAQCKKCPFLLIDIPVNRGLLPSNFEAQVVMKEYLSEGRKKCKSVLKNDGVELIGNKKIRLTFVFRKSFEQQEKDRLASSPAWVNELQSKMHNWGIGIWSVMFPFGGLSFKNSKTMCTVMGDGFPMFRLNVKYLNDGHTPTFKLAQYRFRLSSNPAKFCTSDIGKMVVPIMKKFDMNANTYYELSYWCSVFKQIGYEKSWERIKRNLDTQGIKLKDF
jgi:hypothetical protein